MRTLALAALLLVTLPIAFAVAACGGVEFFPKCDNPKKPCPNVQPEYPPETPLGIDRKQRDAGDAG